MIQPGDHIADLILSAAIDDQLTLEEARQANAHLETCSVCRARLDELRSVVGLLRALPTLEAPRDFSIGPRLVADPPNVVRLRRWYGFARAGAASLAAAFVFLSAGALYVDSQPGSSTGALAARSQVASAPAAAVPAESGTGPQNASAAQSGAAVKSAPAPTQTAATLPLPAAVRAVAPAAAAPPVPGPAAPTSASAAASGAGAADAAPPAAAAAGQAAPAAAQSAPAAPAAAPAAPAAPPAAVATRSQAAPSTTGAEVADQVTAATSVRPLPTPVPTLAPIPTRAPPQLAPVPVTATSVDSAYPLRIAAASVGILAVFGLLATLVIRHRLRAAAISPTE